MICPKIFWFQIVLELGLSLLLSEKNKTKQTGLLYWIIETEEYK